MRGAKTGHVNVHEIRAATHHAAGPAHPCRDHLAPPHEVFLRLRLYIREARTLAIRSRVSELFLPRWVMLHVIKLGDGFGYRTEARIAGDVTHALAVNA